MTHDFADTLLAVALGRAIAADLSPTTREPLPEEWRALLERMDAIERPDAIEASSDDEAERKIVLRS
jgi:hypothetical protein